MKKYYTNVSKKENKSYKQNQLYKLQWDTIKYISWNIFIKYNNQTLFGLLQLKRMYINGL